MTNAQILMHETRRAIVLALIEHHRRSGHHLSATDLAAEADILMKWVG